MPTGLVPTADIRVNGAELSYSVLDAVRSVRVEMSMWEPSRCTVRMVDPDFEITDLATFEVGKDLTVAVPSADGLEHTAVFAGEITDVSVETGASHRHELVVGALDRAHRLAVATNVRSFANQTYAQIVQKVATEAGLSAEVTVSGGPLEYYLQTTSDYTLLRDIALRTGADWWVDDHTLHFKERASTPGVTVRYGRELVDFRVRYSGASRPNQVKVRGWDSGTQQPIIHDDNKVLTSQSVPDIGATSPLALDGRRASNATWGKPVVTGSFAVADTAEATAVADALAARVDAAEVLARGVTAIEADIKVGHLVRVADMGRRVSGDYLVTSVEHIVSPERVETHFTAGNKAPVGITDLLGRQPAGGPGRWGAAGLVVGKVTAITGDPDAVGRVRVKFPTLSDSDTSAWARVVSPGAGPDRGLRYTPEVNDEVLVGFEHGDYRFPVVLGGLWSKVNKPPVPAADPVVSRMIKSRLGHTFDIGDGDADTARHFSMALADGENSFRLGADKTDLVVKSGNAVSIVAGSTSIKIDTNGGVTIEGGAVTIKATKDLSLKGANVNIDADRGVTIGAKGAFKASGNGGATLEGGASDVTIKGLKVQIN